MKNKIFIIIAAALFLFGCGGSNNGHQKDKRIAKGPVKYGGVFHVNETADFRSLYPLNVTEAIEQQIDNQIYEGLVKLDQSNLSVIPSLAYKWDVNDSATIYTFYIKKGVHFQDDPCFPGGKGREVTANDFKYCLDKICEASPQNQMYWLFKDKVKGAKAYYKSTQAGHPLPGGVAGIKVIDQYTLQITLVRPFSPFLKIMSHPACWVYPKEAFEKYGANMRTHCVGTGPFMLRSIKRGQAVILVRNPNYWKKDQYGNQLPYLDAIKTTFIKEKKTELLKFKKGQLDMVYQIPTEMVKDVVAKFDQAKKGGNLPFILQDVPAMSVFYYGFQNKLPPFNNKYVRKAFNFAIDKQSIVTYTLEGEGRPAMYGIVPPFKGYNYQKIHGYSFNPDSAKYYLEKAGYPDGKGFPQITLQTNTSVGGRNLKIAEVVQKMLKTNLNVDIKINVMQFAEMLDAIETGKAKFWRTGWIADYPDPENFLNLLYGKNVPADIHTKSYINSVRYQSTTFDSLFEAAQRETNTAKRYDLYIKADQVAINDAAIMPILYDENMRLLQIYVKNFPINAMEYRDFSEVYFDKSESKK